MAEMKNICGKIPMDLHEKVREEIELTESSTQKIFYNRSLKNISTDWKEKEK